MTVPPPPAVPGIARLRVGPRPARRRAASPARGARSRAAAPVRRAAVERGRGMTIGRWSRRIPRPVAAPPARRRAEARRTSAAARRIARRRAAAAAPTIVRPAVEGSPRVAAGMPNARRAAIGTTMRGRDTLRRGVGAIGRARGRVPVVRRNAPAAAVRLAADVRVARRVPAALAVAARRGRAGVRAGAGDYAGSPLMVRAGERRTVAAASLLTYCYGNLEGRGAVDERSGIRRPESTPACLCGTSVSFGIDLR